MAIRGNRKRKQASWAWKPDARTLRGIHRGNRTVAAHHRSFDPPLEEDNTMATKIAINKKSTSKKSAVRKAPAKKSAPKAKAAVKVDPNLVSLKELIKSTDVDAKAARRKLRTAGIKGHDPKARWSFSKDQVAAAKKVLGLK